jgi:ABC-2 type transport system permease protein
MFGKLIINEMYKSFLQKKTIGLLILVLLLTGVLAYFVQKDDVKGDWRKKTEKEIVVLKKDIESAKALENTDKQFLKYQETQLKMKERRLAEDIPENVTTPLRFVYICSNNITIILMLFMAAFSADVIASEFSWGTIRQIFVKPVKRWKIYLAKFCSTIFVSFLLYMFYLIVAIVVGYLVFKGNSTTIYELNMEDYIVQKFNMIDTIFWTTLAQLFALAVVSTITFFIATLTRKSALAIIITFIVFFGGAAMTELFYKYTWYKYILIPNLTLNAYLPGGWVPYPGATFNFSLGVCLAYAITFFTAGILIYNKRDVY